MPARPLAAVTPAFAPLADQRRSERRACSAPAMVRAGGGEYPARILDLSLGGVGLRIDTLIGLKPGAVVTAIHAGLGEIDCVLRWAMHPRYGAQFRLAQHANRQLPSFYDTLPHQTD